MVPTPRWYLPVAVLALVWNLFGCAAYLSDVTMTPDDIAKLSAQEQALYAGRPVWAVAGFAIAVWGGAAGSLGLVLRKRWALPVLVASVVGLIVQDFGLLMAARGAGGLGPAVMVLQPLVLVVAIGLVVFARRAAARGWLA